MVEGFLFELNFLEFLELVHRLAGSYPGIHFPLLDAYLDVEFENAAEEI